jgi:hypothetical protein
MDVFLGQLFMHELNERLLQDRFTLVHLPEQPSCSSPRTACFINSNSLKLASEAGAIQ